MPDRLIQLGVLWLGAVALIACGILYQFKPDLFQRGIWKHTAISQRVLTPAQNRVYMRILGGIFIVAGILIIVFAEPLLQWIARHAPGS